MDCTATTKGAMAIVRRRFGRTRLSEEVLATAYEQLVPMIRHRAGLRQEHRERRLLARQSQQARRA